MPLTVRFGAVECAVCTVMPAVTPGAVQLAGWSSVNSLNTAAAGGWEPPSADHRIRSFVVM